MGVDGLGGIEELDLGKKKRFQQKIESKIFLESLIKEIQETEGISSSNASSINKENLAAALPDGVERSLLGNITDISGLTPEVLANLSDEEAIDVLYPIVSKYINELP